MLYCEDCRVKRNYNLPSTWPYGRYESGRCELCQKTKTCYDYPLIYIKPKSTWSAEEILLDKALQNEYHSKSESLVITYVVGSQAGSLDHQRTEQLKTVFAKNSSGEVDWYATFELRQRIQQGYKKKPR